MKTKTKEFILGRPEKIIKKYGYEYHLVESDERKGSIHPEPCALGFPGWVLKSVNKIK